MNDGFMLALVIGSNLILLSAIFRLEDRIRKLEARDHDK